MIHNLRDIVNFRLLLQGRRRLDQRAVEGLSAPKSAPIYECTTWCMIPSRRAALPIEVRPAPGMVAKPRPKPPLSPTPQVANPAAASGCGELERKV